MNGQVVAERTRANDLMVNAAGQIVRFCETDEKAVETIFLVVLSRRPTDDESKFLVEYIQSQSPEPISETPDSRTQKIEDIFWSLFNKLEFLRNH